MRARLRRVRADEWRGMIVAEAWWNAFIDWVGEGLVGEAEWERRRQRPEERSALAGLSLLVALVALMALPTVITGLGVLVGRALWAVVWFLLSVWVPMSILGILIGVLVQ